MSTICLAAQRSYTTGEAVWFSYRFPGFNKIAGLFLLWMAGLCAMLIAGVYAHIYWNLRHPAPEPVKVSIAKPETQLSDMHYVYVSKPFPHPQPKPAPQHESAHLPAMQDLPLNSDDTDWQQAPEGNVARDTSRDTLPGTDAHENAFGSTDNNDASLRELFKQALQEQQQDYSQGKVPAPPVDETQDISQSHSIHQGIKESPLARKGDRLE